MPFWFGFVKPLQFGAQVHSPHFPWFQACEVGSPAKLALILSMLSQPSFRSLPLAKIKSLGHPIWAYFTDLSVKLYHLFEPETFEHGPCRNICEPGEPLRGAQLGFSIQTPFIPRIANSERTLASLKVIGFNLLLSPADALLRFFTFYGYQPSFFKIPRALAWSLWHRGSRWIVPCFCFSLFLLFVCLHLSMCPLEAPPSTPVVQLSGGGGGGGGVSYSPPTRLWC